MSHRLRALASFSLSAALLLAAWSKLSNPASWYYNLLHYRILPEILTRPLVWFTPALEVVVALALCLPSWRPAGRLLCIALGTVFVVFIASAWARGLDITCGCFGGATPVGPLSLARALVFLTLSFLLPTATNAKPLKN